MSESIDRRSFAKRGVALAGAVALSSRLERLTTDAASEPRPAAWDLKTLLARQEFEDPDTIENRGARNMAWDRRPGEHIYPYECDPTFVLNYGNKT